MPITTTHIDILRAQVAGDEEGLRRASSQMTDTDVPGYECLLQAALSIAAGERFAAGYSDNDVIGFVAQARAGTSSRDEDIALDPLGAEMTLRFALGQSNQQVQDPQTRLRSTMALLTVLIGDLNLKDEAVDALIGRAIPLADRWLVASS